MWPGLEKIGRCRFYVFFLRVSDHLESICKILFSPVTTADSPVGGAAVRPFLPKRMLIQATIVNFNRFYQ